MIKGAKSIAEYMIRRWLQAENLEVNEFQLVMNGNEAKLIDCNNEEMILVYDSDSKTVYIKE